MTTLYDHEMQDKEMARLFAQEQLIEEAGELVAVTMQREGVSKADLARRIGTSKAHITQLLAGSRNMTLRTLGDLMHAMNHRVFLTSMSSADAHWSEIVCSAVKVRQASVLHRWEHSELFAQKGVYAA
ncbi:MAG: helix-turn-helix transcriptional regulator [Phycisphaerales bacterium]|nr:MAG: helix-turn-helix transcriptional regulator [Phycisphaerales bacterium]